jgi:hypothetical protein
MGCKEYLVSGAESQAFISISGDSEVASSVDASRIGNCAVCGKLFLGIYGTKGPSQPTTLQYDLVQDRGCMYLTV